MSKRRKPNIQRRSGMPQKNGIIFVMSGALFPCYYWLRFSSVSVVTLVRAGQRNRCFFTVLGPAVGKGSRDVKFSTTCVAEIKN